jgi:hypothetical protein
VLVNLTNLARQVFTQFQQIQDFSVEKNPSNPIAVRDGLINQIRDQWSTYFSVITPIIAYSVRRGTDFEGLEREARGSAALLNQMVPEMRATREKILAEANLALEKVRQAAAEAGVAEHAIHFQREAESHRKQSFVWLVFAALFAVGIVRYAVYSLDIQLHDLAQNLPASAWVPIAISRVLIISILSYGLLFCARNYGASRHNFVVNRHRQNALSSFDTFVKASGDPQTKDAVLLQATQSIFAPQASGYLKVEGELQPSSQIVEVFRRLTGAKPD